ncbi:MAG: Do family serine endopeptidase [Gammaproteobacteria bacterium]|nr:Do family serine endopeptidase [Gammaproteobacteria bacterium]
MLRILTSALKASLAAVLFLVAMPAAALSGLPDFTELVRQHHQAVVNISTTSRVEAPGEGLQIPELNNKDLEDLLKKYLPQPDRMPSPSPDSSLGSGFIISSDGYVLTNNHVVSGADEVMVRLYDRRQMIAEVIGTDPRSDVALLKIDATGLPVVVVGESDPLQVGEWVLAIGSPFGFDFSVTAGIVSAKGRALPNENYVPFIQTDVAINPGNSGGPLFNLRGEVIGVNSQIYSRTGGFMGLSFAIPIEMAMDVADQLRNSGRVSRGWLGVVIQEVTKELAESFDMKVAHGALIKSILADSPAANSDLEVGDVITHFNGKRVETSSSLPPLVGRVRANRSADVRVLRSGESIELRVKIGELPSQDDLVRARTGSGNQSATSNILQIKVEELDDETREQLGIDAGGVLITEVMNDGPAGQAGIQPGVALLRVDNAPVDSVEQFNEVLETLRTDKPVAVLIHREEGPEFLALKLDE